MIITPRRYRWAAHERSWYISPPGSFHMPCATLTQCQLPLCDTAILASLAHSVSFSRITYVISVSMLFQHKNAYRPMLMTHSIMIQYHGYFFLSSIEYAASYLFQYLRSATIHFNIIVVYLRYRMISSFDYATRDISPLLRPWRLFHLMQRLGARCAALIIVDFSCYLPQC